MAGLSQQAERRIVAAERSAAERSAKGAVAGHDAVAAQNAVKGAKESFVLTGLETVGRVSGYLWPLDMAASAVAIPVGYAAKLVAGDKGKAWVHGVLKSPIKAIQETFITNIGALPANATKAFANAANENNAPALAARASAASEKLATSGARFTHSVNKVFAPIGKATSGFFERAAQRAEAGNASGVVTDLANWRAARIDKKILPKITEKIIAANNNLPLNWVGKLMQAFGKNVEYVSAPALTHAAPILHAVQTSNGNPEIIRKAIAAVNDNVPANLADDVKKRLGSVVELAEKAATQLEKKAALTSVAKGGFSAIIAGIPKALSRVSLFHAILATGIAAGGVALAMRASQDSAASDTALKEMAADLYGVSADKVTAEMISGKNAPLILQKAASKSHAEARGNWAAAGLRTAGEAAFLIPSAAAMIANMALTSGSDMLKSDNPFVKAYGALKEAESAPQKMTEQLKMPLVSMLVAASPAFEKHGGLRNKMVQPIAQQMIKQGLSAKQIAFEIADVKAMERRAADTAKAPMTAPQETAKAPMIESPAKPDMKASGIVSQGRIADVQRAVSA